MTFSIEGRSPSGSGRGSTPMTKAELLAEFESYLESLRAGDFQANEFRVVWDQSDEPHVFAHNPMIREARVCRVCQDYESGEQHIPESRRKPIVKTA